MAIRTNSDSAEFYEAKDGTVMFRMNVGQIADLYHPPLEIVTVADDIHKRHYPGKWEKFVNDRQKVLEVALENEAASKGG